MISRIIKTTYRAKLKQIEEVCQMETSNNYKVYKHTNQINGKSYVGITCQKPEYRWGTDGQGYKECPFFWNAIQKYGWNNFSHEIIFEGLTHEEACD